MKLIMTNESIIHSNTRSIIERRARLGCDESESGSHLIGRTAHIAPKAYLHVIHRPLTEAEVAQFELDFGRALPRSMRLFLQVANGFSLFNGCIRMRGYLPIKREYPVHPHCYPSNMIAYNTNPLPAPGLSFAFYKYDQSCCHLCDSGRVFRYHYGAIASVIDQWGSMTEWLDGEVSRLDRFFDEEGKPNRDLKASI